MADVPNAENGSSQRLVVGAGAMLAGRLVMAAMSWGGTVLVARQLGQEDFGRFVLVFGLLGMLSIVTDLGLGQVAVASHGRVSGDRAVFAGSYILLRLCLGLVGAVVAVGFVVLAGYPRPVVEATVLGGVIVVLATPQSAYDLPFLVRERYSSLTLLDLAGQLVQLIATVAIVVRGGSLLWFVVPAILNEAMILVIKVPMAHRLLAFRYRVDAAAWRSLLREAVPLTLGTAFVTLYYRVDTVMLASLDGFEATGDYGVAYKFVDLVHFVPTVLAAALLAPLAVAWRRDRAEFSARLREAAQLLSVAAAGAIVGFTIFGRSIAVLFYGEQYANAGELVGIVIVGEAVGFSSALAITALLAADRHRVYPYITAAGLLLNVSANLLLIPRWSTTGAAITTVVTEVAVAVALSRRVRRLGIGSLMEARVAAGLLVSAAAAAVIGVGGQRVLPWPIAALAAAIVLLVGAGASGSLSFVAGRPTRQPPAVPAPES